MPHEVTFYHRSQPQEIAPALTMPDVPAEAVHLLGARLPQGDHEVDVFGDADLLHSMETK